MKEKILNILLIEDNPDDIFLMEEMLDEARKSFDNSYRINLVVAETVEQGLKKIEQKDFDIVLSDLTLPDSRAMDTILKLKINELDIPVVILTGLNSNDVAFRAIQFGVQDYLIKGNFSGEMLLRTIFYSIERFKLISALKSFALIDELTGLYNRRGFMVLAENQMKIALRKKRKIAVAFFDMDNLKHINDEYGHREGDKAIIDSAIVLKKSFRSTDIIARIGGDEFVVMAIETEDEVLDVINERIETIIFEHNADSNAGYNLSLSYGIKLFDGDKIGAIEQVLDEVDKLMYENKMKKRGESPQK